MSVILAAMAAVLAAAPAGAAPLLPVDRAALELAERLGGQARNRELSAAFSAELSALRKRRSAREELGRYRFLFVPGFLYRADPTTGADLAAQRRLFDELGLDTALIETDEAAGVEENARVIARCLAAERGPVIVISASKGGLEAALALAGIPVEQSSRVRAWVSVGGTHRGTPLAEQALRWPWRWLGRLVLGRRALGAAAGMTPAEWRPRFAALRFPPSTLILQVVALPLSGEVSKDVRGRWTRLARLGPNDGITLIEDELIEGARVLILRGLDHYFRDPEIGLKTLAIANVLSDMLSATAEAPSPDRTERPAPMTPEPRRK